ncbi:glutathione S-transferase family protein [Chachezhania sediminis]|uniref:glutathione S-transferase family protein n=1 Tax=Chachezhania sediminis TaxID=2599291 RepID=UPI00131C2788|nr:glutathione S-transferase [Chachezhania sediminis]
MITVHYLEKSRAHRVAWLLEELGVEYDLKVYKRGPDMLAPAELRKIHPLGKSPVIQDGDLVLAETGAIVEYLLERYGPKGLRPEPGTAVWVSYLYFMHSSEGSVMPLLTNRLVYSRMGQLAPALIRPIARAIGKQMDDRLVAPALPGLFDLWARALSQTGWFAGDFSAADVMMSFPVQAAVARTNAAQGRPALAEFVKRIEARPAYQRAQEKGAFELL